MDDTLLLTTSHEPENLGLCRRWQAGGRVAGREGGRQAPAS